MAEFKVKLISCRNIILVEKDGHDPEVFFPKIVNGRITLLNIIRNRRCCANIFSNSAEVISDVRVEQKPSGSSSTSTIFSQNLLPNSTEIINNNSKNHNSSADNSIQQLRRQTLTNDIWRQKLPAMENFQKNSFQELPMLPESFSLPESPGIQNFSKNSFQELPMLSDSFLLPAEVKFCSKPKSSIGKLKILTPHNIPSSNTTKKAGRILTVPLPIKENMQNKSFIETSWLNKSHFNIQNAAASTPINPKLIFKTSPIQTVTKWRKCITPIRTYSKNSEGRTNLNLTSKSPRMVPLEKIDLPDFIRNQTKGFDGNSVLVIKKCKTIIDPKTKISSSEYKKQLHDYSDLTATNWKLPATKKKLEFAQWSNYDFLTNPSWFRRNEAKKLRTLFKKRCMKKIVEPSLKYKALASLEGTIDRVNCMKPKLVEGKLQPRKLRI